MITKAFFYIATGDGVYKSNDKCHSWKRFSKGLPYDDRTDSIKPMVLKLAVDTASGDLYSRVALNGFGIYKTGCDNPEWRAIGNGLPSESITIDLAYSPIDKSTYIINGSSGVIVIGKFKSSSMGVYRGRNGSRSYSWSKETSLPVKSDSFEPVRELVTDPNTGELYACTYLGLFRKTGKKWQREVSEYFVSSVVFEEGNSKRAIAATPDKVLLRKDGKWQPILNRPWHIHATIVSANFYKGSIYVSTNDGLYASKDNAEHWSKIQITDASR